RRKYAAQAPASMLRSDRAEPCVERKRVAVALTREQPGELAAFFDHHDQHVFFRLPREEDLVRIKILAQVATGRAHFNFGKPCIDRLDQHRNIARSKQLEAITARRRNGGNYLLDAGPACRAIHSCNGRDGAGTRDSVPDLETTARSSAPARLPSSTCRAVAACTDATASSRGSGEKARITHKTAAIATAVAAAATRSASD